DDFATFMDVPFLITEFYNRMTWQLALSFNLDKRANWREQNTNSNDAAILELAKENLSKFRVVGFQHQFSSFIDKLNTTYGLTLVNKQKNVTKKRARPQDIDSKLRARIQQWTYLDDELYKFAFAQYADKSDQDA